MGHNEPKSGILYVVSTPIGNLEDITLRALEVLGSVDQIAAENISHTRRLCERHSIRTKLVRFNQHNQKAKAPELVRKMSAGLQIAIVTDAGTPGISDPGVSLIHQAARAGIRVVPIPGPSAVIAALSVSGFPTERFVFAGFLPNKAGKRRSELEDLASETRTMVFFEAPHRLEATLKDMKDILGDRSMVMVREMTKVFEEIQRGTIGEIIFRLTPETVRGEFTLVVAGSDKEEKAEALSGAARKRIDELLGEGMTLKDVAKRISEEEGLPYRRVYKECLTRKEMLAHGGSHQKATKNFTIQNKLGLHARAAARIVELGNRYESRLFLRKDDKEVDGSSILSILTLSCPKGTEILARIEGRDSAQFMEKLEELFETHFGERA
jgi:16S rRNA (cytidine1402-2'-O)-methyltransferase